MANYVGKGRSNYFKVKDLKKFDDFINEFEDLSIIKKVDDASNQLVGFLIESESGAIPSYVFNESLQDFEEVDFLSGLSKHLQEDQVAVIKEVGAEKMRYIHGCSTAVNARGETLFIDLGDIYEHASDRWGVDVDEIEDCSY